MNAGETHGQAALGDAHLLVAEPLPLIEVPAVPRVTRMHAHDDAEVLHALPEGIELRERE